MSWGMLWSIMSFRVGNTDHVKKEIDEYHKDQQVYACFKGHKGDIQAS